MKAKLALLVASLFVLAFHFCLIVGGKDSAYELDKSSVTEVEQGNDPRYDLYSRFIIVPEHRLLFCYIEKVGCTIFNKLFNSLRSRYDPSLITGGIWFRHTYRTYGLSIDALKSYVSDPSWHKAVFYREPLERFLSGFRSKCEPHHDTDTFNCEETFGSHRASFPSAVYRLKEENPIFNPHWIPQSEFCGGLRENLQYFRTVEMLNTETIEEKVGTLMHDIGVDPQTIPAFSLFSPNMTSEPKKKKKSKKAKFKHETNAAEDIELYYSKPEFVCIVMKYYLSDYELFDIPVPEWVHKFDYRASPQLEEECNVLIEHGLLPEN